MEDFKKVKRSLGFCRSREMVVKAAVDASTFPKEFRGLIFVKYCDHVLFNRNVPFAMKPQVREAVGWLIYECGQYITLSWDRDAEPPSLHSCDSKASGLVLIRSDILELKKLE